MSDLHASDLRRIFQPNVIQNLDPSAVQQILCLLFYPQHDPGPNCRWEQLFNRAPLNYYTNFPGTPFHTRFGPVFFRGRLDGKARLLVIGQDPATDEILAQRAFVGQAGQIVQNLLTRLGLTRSYVMFNTFLFGIQSANIQTSTVLDPTIMAYRNSLFDRAKATNNLEAIIAFGGHANTSAQNWSGRGSIPIIHLFHPSASGVAANWNSHLATAQSHITPDLASTSTRRHTIHPGQCPTQIFQDVICRSIYRQPWEPAGLHKVSAAADRPSKPRLSGPHLR